MATAGRGAIKTRIFNLAWHPFLMAAYPILALLAHNRSQATPWMAYRALVLALLLALLLFGLLRLLLRNSHKAGLWVSLSLAIFFTYGHLFTWIEDRTLLGINIGRHRILLGLALVLLLAAFLWLWRTKRDLAPACRGLNAILAIALVFPLVQLVSYETRAALDAGSAEAQASEGALPAELASLSLPSGGSTPDIYYIVLDTYARDDTLLQYVGFDNTPFLEELEKRGFWIARCSQSNYPFTQTSLVSSLNLEYLDALGLEIGDVEEPTALNQELQHNRARRALEELGYKVVATDSGYSPTAWLDADMFLSPDSSPGKANFTGGINAFEAVLLRSSAGIWAYELKDQLPKEARAFLDTAYTEHRTRILYAFDALEDVPELPGPKFVFVHLIAPHSPFVFGPNGEIVGRKTPFTLNDDLEIREPEKYIQKYRDQLQYVNRRILPVIDAILEKSAVPPIIILQGDHGLKAQVSSENGRMTILNAYYIPNGEEIGLYDSITPVNTFRVLFNLYFGGSLPLLEDASYFAHLGDPEKQVTVSPNQREGCLP